ncbi:histone H1/H5 family protein [Aspergillus clavatus NRRL 1]|uniref:Histone H1 n=1 Tax=Aspergillus clavatus (strain ATCC 1007 / CBS 513.65 / DSM 816 / NCTC 3887 / NRRL 1 / QM 1276 / 107) TaxID=344612 RepID=A1CJ76_ASPCL|nr:histone H1 [Aspergillus clavatus NRRL 1]EAW09200.1 histone H1 [Aspergillus clavatus NRRL 1]
MPPKKASTAGATKKTASGHASYRDMIKDAILNLKERNGSSRQSIKKYVLANNKIAVVTQAAFDSQFNKAIKAGVEKGEFTQPKGTSGPVKLAKKEPAAKPAAKKATTASTTKAAAAPKKAAAAKKTEKTEKAEKAEKPAAKATTKKAAATTKKAPGKPKANTAKPRKASTAAPAVVDQPKVISTTKSGRVTKTTAKPAEKATKKRATKATAAKKAEKAEKAE